MKYALRHPVRWLLRVDCAFCRAGRHLACDLDRDRESDAARCYCRIIRGHL